MKHLFFVAVASGIISGTTITAEAQANVNIERFVKNSSSKGSPKFIDGFEFRPESTSSTLVVEVENSNISPVIVSKPSQVKSGFAGNIEHCTSLQFKFAMMMDIEVESISNFSLYNFIDDWWGTRYRYGGSDRSGIDCSAFTGRLLSEVYGLPAPRTAKDQYKLCEKLPASDLVEGDLVFFNTTGGVSHVGLYLGNNYFVHSSISGGVTISSLNEDYYGRKFISGGRIAPSSLAAGKL